MTSRNRSASGRFYDWPAVVRRTRAAPGLFQLLLPNVPVSVVKAIRLRRHEDLILRDGRLEARAENRYTDPDGRERANVWVRFVPNGTVTRQDTPHRKGHTS